MYSVKIWQKVIHCLRMFTHVSYSSSHCVHWNGWRQLKPKFQKNVLDNICLRTEQQQTGWLLSIIHNVMLHSVAAATLREIINIILCVWMNTTELFLQCRVQTGRRQVFLMKKIDTFGTLNPEVIFGVVRQRDVAFFPDCWPKQLL